jgi:hypothetical protein
MARRDSKRRSRKADPATVIGIGWYDPAQWAKLKEIATDPDHLDESHEAWQRMAERTLQELTAQGYAVRRVPIDVDALLQWCRAHNKAIDGKARAEYTSQIIMGALPG